MRVATAYIISQFLFNHKPSSWYFKNKQILKLTRFIYLKYLYLYSVYYDSYLFTFERTSKVLNSFKFSISASGSQNSLMKLTSTGIQASISSPTKNMAHDYTSNTEGIHLKRKYSQFDQHYIIIFHFIILSHHLMISILRFAINEI